MLVVSLLLLQLGANFAVLRIVKGIFEQGTDCEVELSLPAVSFFPLRAVARNVSFRHPEEQQASFQVAKIHIRLDILPLFEKRVMLSDLRIWDALIQSERRDSAFLRTIDFVTGKRKKKKNSSWKVRLDNLEILASDSGRAQLELEVEGVKLKWQEPEFALDKRTAKDGEIYRTNARAASFEILDRSKRLYSFGKLGASGAFLKDGIRFDRVQFGRWRQEEKNGVVAEGKLFLGEEPRYQLEVRADAAQDYLGMLFVHAREGFRSSNARVKFTGSIDGPLRSPTSSGDFEVSVKNGFVKGQIDGTLLPLDLEGKADARLDLEDARDRSRLGANFSANTKRLEIQLVERGELPQLLQAPAQPIEETRFVTTKNSSFDLSLRYDFSEDQLRIPKLVLVRYPAEKLLQRIAPFIPTKAQETIATFVSRESLVDANLRGEFEKANGELTGGGSVEFRKLNLLELSVEELSSQMNLKSREIRFEKIRAETKGGPINGSFRISLDGALQAEADFQSLDLDSVKAVAKYLPGIHASATGDLSVSGTTSAPKYQGAIEVLASSKSRPEQIVNSSVKLRGEAGELEVDGELFDGRADLSLSLPLGSESQKELALKLVTDKLPLDYFLQEHTEQGEGIITAKLDYRGPVATPLTGQGLLVVEELRLDRADFHLRHELPLQARLSDGRMHFKNLALLAGERELNLSGFVDHKEGWQARLSGKWRIEDVLTDLAFVEQLAGEASVDLELSGPFAKPQFDGVLRIDDATVSFPVGNTVIGADRGHIEALLSKDQIRIPIIEAYLGAGRIVGSGVFDRWQDEKNSQLDVRLLYSDVSLEPFENLALTLSGDLKAERKGLEPLQLSGDVQVDRGLYEENINLAKMLKGLTEFITGARRAGAAPRSKKKIATKEADETSASPLEFALKFHAPGSLVVETNLAQAQLGADLLLAGSLQEPRLSGEILANHGVFGTGSSQFEIITAKARFPKSAMGLDPNLEIVGETSLRTSIGEEQQVRISILGTITEPDVSFASDGGLSEEEIISLLGFGTNIEGPQFADSTVGRASLVQLVNPGSGVSLGERVKALTGFSDVELDTAYSPQVGGLVPRIVARRPLVGDLDLQLKSELSEAQTSDVGLEYPLNDRLSVISGWRSRSITEDVESGVGSFGLGLRYRRSFPGLSLFPKQSSEKIDVQE